MPSYNEIDGVPSHANVWLLQKVLRGEWGFKGAVVSDYYAIEDLQTLHHIAGDVPKRRRAWRSKAGVDIDLPSGGAYATLTQQVRDGTRAEDEHRHGGAPLADAEIPRRPVRASLRRCRAGGGAHEQSGSARAGAQGRAAHHRSAQERRHAAAAAAAARAAPNRSSR